MKKTYTIGKTQGISAYEISCVFLFPPFGYIQEVMNIL